MGRCRGVPFEFPNILIRLLSSPRRAGGRTNKMNTNYLNTNYKSNERALADLLGQLVRGRNSSPSSYNRGGGGGGGGMGGSGMSGGGGGPMNNYSGSSIGGRGGGGSGGWGGNQSNDWNQGSGVGGGGGFGNAGGSGNLMPLMQRDVGMNMNNSGGGGFGGMPQGGGFGGMTDNFGMQQGNSYMGMSGGNSGGFGGMQQNVGMNNGGFGGGGGGGFPQNNNFGGDGYGDCPPLPAIRSRGTWVTGSASRSSRNAPTSQGRSSRNAPTPQGRSSNRPTSSTQDRRSLGGSKASLSSRSIRSGGGAASGNSSKPEQAQKRKAPPSSVPPAKISNNASNAKPTTAQVNKTTSAEPRRVLTSVGGRWYQHFLTKGLKPEEARKKAFENNNKPFTVGVQGAASKNKSKSTKKPSTPPADKYVRLAIFAKGFPETMLDPEDLSSLEEMIVEEIANNSTETKLQFERLLRKPGMIFFDCVNQQTADWLKDLIPKLPHWENPELEVCSEDDIPRDAYIMILSLPNSAGQEYDQTLAIIQAQNADLVTDSWEWVHEREDGDRLTLTIRVDEESYTAIKEKKWKIFYKFNVVDVSFVRYIRYALQKQLNEESAVTTSKDESKANEQQPTDESDKTEMAVDLTEEADEENQPSPPPAPVISK